MNRSLLTINFKESLALAAGVLVGFVTLFSLAEPAVTLGQAATRDFYIRQTITAESTFLVDPTNVTMSNTINGVSGGTATGTSQFVVQTNNAAGYRVDISFEDNGTAQTMIGDESGSEAILDYGGDTPGGEPTLYVASTSAQFAYTVTSSSSPDTDPSFFNDGADCNTGGSQAVPCWKEPETGAFTIVERAGPAITGATSTVIFNVTVPSGASPVPSAETYTATATLSLYNLP